MDIANPLWDYVILTQRIFMRNLVSRKFSKTILFFATSIACQGAFSANLTEQVTQKLQTRVSVLDREMVTFRYESKANDKIRSLDDLKARIQGWSERYFDKSVDTNDMAGPGTYVAIDPFSSRDYGGSDPQLYVLTLKKGTRLLDLDKGLKSEEKNLIIKLYRSLQCDSRDGTQSTVVDSDIDYLSLRLSPKAACREAAIEIVQKLNIHALIYSYVASNSLSDCRERYVALNVISSAAIDFSKALFYSNKYSIEATDSGHLIKKLYEESEEDLQLKLGWENDFQIPSELEKKSLASESEYNMWKKRKIYNCGPKWPSEKGTPTSTGIMLRNLKRNYQDKEIEALALNLKKSFLSKQGVNRNFYLADFVILQKLNFMASGLPWKEENFRHFLYLSKNSLNKNYQEEIKKIFSTPKTRIDLEGSFRDLPQYIMSLSKQEQLSPDMYFKFLARLKIPQGYAAVIFNESNLNTGKVIMSSMDPKKPFAENLAISKRAHKAALQKCIAMYSDPKLSFQDIQNTDCGMIRDEWLK